MARYNGSVTRNSSYYSCYLEVTENNINKLNNTSVVTVKFHIVRSSYGWSAGAAQSGNIVIDGSTYSFSYKPNWGYGSNGDVVVGSASKTVAHNSDGKKSCATSATWNTSGTYSCGTASASGTLTLTTIPRESKITASNANIGSVSQLVINKNVSTYTTTLKYKFATQTDWTTLVEKTDASTYAFEIPDSFYELIPNSQTGICTVEATTYSGNIQIGSPTTTTFTVSTVESESKPLINIATAEDTVTKCTVLTGSNKRWIKCISRPKIIWNASARKSATIVSQKISSVEATSPYVASEWKDLWYLLVTDSRGYFQENWFREAEGYTIIPYSIPIINASGIRQSPTSNRAIVSFKGSYYNGYFDANNQNLNQITVNFKYRKYNTEEWTIVSTPITITIENNIFSANNVDLGNLFDYRYSWEIQMLVTDSLEEQGAYSIVIPKGKPCYNAYEDAEGNNFFDVNGTYLQNGELLSEQWQRKIVTGQEYETNEIIDGKKVYHKRIDTGNVVIAGKTTTIGLKNVTIVRMQGIARFDLNRLGSYGIPSSQVDCMFDNNGNIYMWCASGFHDNNELKYSYLDLFYTKESEV